MWKSITDSFMMCQNYIKAFARLVLRSVAVGWRGQLGAKKKMGWCGDRADGAAQAGSAATAADVLLVPRRGLSRTWARGEGDEKCNGDPEEGSASWDCCRKVRYVLRNTFLWQLCGRQDAAGDAVEGQAACPGSAALAVELPGLPGQHGQLSWLVAEVQLERFCKPV